MVLFFRCQIMLVFIVEFPKNKTLLLQGSGLLNGRERMITALSLGIPDRVPHWELAYNESSVVDIAGNYTDDLPAAGYIQTMEPESKAKLMNALLLFIEELDVDGLTLRVFPSSEIIDAEHVRDDWGVTFQLSPVGEATVVDGPIKNVSDLKKYRPPSIQEQDLFALIYCVERFKKQRAMVLSLQCPFRRSWNLVGGMDKLFYAYLENPHMVHQIARIVTDYTIEAIELAVKLGADIISLDGDLAHNTNMLISPKHFREYVKPYYIEIVKHIHHLGLKVFKHTDGNHMKIFDDLLEIGFNGIHPIQPQCMDLAEVKEKYGDKICLMGNIDCIETLVKKDLKAVEEEVKSAIEIAAPGGGYILASSNTIHPGVKAANYIAMVKAAHRYGKYDKKGMPVIV